MRVNELIEPNDIIRAFRTQLRDYLSTYRSHRASVTLTKLFGRQGPFWRTHYLKVLVPYLQDNLFFISDERHRLWYLEEIRVKSNSSVHRLYVFVFRRVDGNE